jgi:hypothetical protein
MMIRSLIGLSVLLCFASAEAVAYSGGDGTGASPYVLSCKEDIMELASRTADYDKSFVLTADIDLEGAVFKHSVVAPDIVVIPSFGEYQYVFIGYFNGNGHVIENFSIVGGLGFFGGIGSKGRVMHLGLKGVYIDSLKVSPVGMLAGINMGTIVGCFAQGWVRGYDCVGGLVGYNLDGDIFDCFTQGHVEAIDEAVGGLVGLFWDGEICRCYAASTVYGDSSICGGLVGAVVSGGGGNSSGVVSSSFWDVDVSGLSTSAGGLGLSTAMMVDVSTYLDAGWDFTEEQDNGINDVWMESDEGGYPTLAAFSGVEPAVLLGEGTEESPYVVSTAEELAAMIYYNKYDCYLALDADIDLSGIEWSAPVVAEFHGAFDGQGYSIHGFHQSGSCGLFGVIAGDAIVRNLCLEGCEVIAEDGVVGCLAGENQGRVFYCCVSGVIVGGDVTGGLVGCNELNISHCSFVGAVMGRETAGGLVGENNGTQIINSFSRGVVSGDCNVGGLAGRNSGSIRSCYSTASVVGHSSLGGLLGENGGLVTDCYARGAVAGADCIGGLIGLNSSNVWRCYSTGAITGLSNVGGLIGSGEPSSADVSDSFWEIDSSGVQTSSGGTGVNRDQMQDIDTFLEAGWDFVEETANGIKDVWFIGDDGYPDLTLTFQPVATRR